MTLTVRNFHSLVSKQGAKVKEILETHGYSYQAVLSRFSLAPCSILDFKKSSVKKAELIFEDKYDQELMQALTRKKLEEYSPEHILQVLANSTCLEEAIYGLKVTQDSLVRYLKSNNINYDAIKKIQSDSPISRTEKINRSVIGSSDDIQESIKNLTLKEFHQRLLNGHNAKETLENSGYNYETIKKYFCRTKYPIRKFKKLSTKDAIKYFGNRYYTELTESLKMKSILKCVPQEIAKALVEQTNLCQAAKKLRTAQEILTRYLQKMDLVNYKGKSKEEITSLIEKYNRKNVNKRRPHNDIRLTLKRQKTDNISWQSSMTSNNEDSQVQLESAMQSEEMLQPRRQQNLEVINQDLSQLAPDQQNLVHNPYSDNSLDTISNPNAFFNNYNNSSYEQRSIKNFSQQMRVEVSSPLNSESKSNPWDPREIFNFSPLNHDWENNHDETFEMLKKNRR